MDEGYLAWMATWKAATLAARDIEAAMRSEVGLSLTWGEVLARLDAAPDGRMPMNELARRVFVTRSGISQVVTAMSARSLVERQPDPDNLRVTYAAITREGRELLARSEEVFLGAIQEAFGRHLEKGEGARVATALNRVIAGLGSDPI